MAEQAGQVLRMARPAAYWARRAAIHHRRGNKLQAEALYQHAVDLTPDNIHLKLAYARVLQEMRRYEASNRQAFAALAQDPESVPCIGLIGQNLMALGYPEEAADAYAHALQNDISGMADAYAEQLDRLEALLDEPADCGLRYRILVQRAAEDLSAGEWELAGRELDFACAMPRQDERCRALLSLYYRARGDLPRAVREAEAVCHMTPESVRARCALAELYGAAGRRAQALQSLLLAAARVWTAEEERMLCQTALNLDFPAAPLPALARNGGRVQTLYNQGVLLLRAGEARRALQALDQCRALDPDDVPTRYLRRTAQALSALPRRQAAERARELRLYPALSDADSEACFRDFMQAMDGGPAAFAGRLEADRALYRLTLYQAENPYIDSSGVLEQGLRHLKESSATRLLREILLLPAGGVAEKQLAIQWLMNESAKPFVLWHGGRLSFIRPGGGAETAVELRLKDHLLRSAGAGCDPRIVTHALRLIRRMPPRARAKIAAAEQGDFLSAVRMHYAQAHAVAVPQPVSHQRHVRRLYQMLRRAVPAHENAAPPRLWISGRRKETP